MFQSSAKTWMLFVAIADYYNCHLLSAWVWQCELEQIPETWKSGSCSSQFTMKEGGSRREGGRKRQTDRQSACMYSCVHSWIKHESSHALPGKYDSLYFARGKNRWVIFVKVTQCVLQGQPYLLSVLWSQSVFLMRVHFVFLRSSESPRRHKGPIENSWHQTWNYLHPPTSQSQQCPKCWIHHSSISFTHLAAVLLEECQLFWVLPGCTLQT